MLARPEYRGLIAVSLNPFGGLMSLLEIHATPRGSVTDLAADLETAGIRLRGPIEDAVERKLYAIVPECGVNPVITALVGLGWTVVHDGGLN